MKHLMTLMALVVAVTAGAQVMDTILTGNTVNMNLNYAKLDSIIADLQAKVATLEAAQNSTFDGDYNSLTNQPAIPSNVSDLTNDAGYTTFDGDYNSLSNQPTIPSNVGDLTNDAGYTTFDGNYGSLNGAPTLATVATSGSYTDLSNQLEQKDIVESAYNLYGADLYGADLANASLANASLYNANLYNANLTNAELADADLTGVIWTGAYIENCIGCPCTDANNDNYCD